MTNIRKYPLTEGQRQILMETLRTAFITESNETRSTNLGELVEIFKEPIPDVPLWRTLPDAVQDACVLEIMDIEGIDKHRAQEDLDEEDELLGLFMLFSDRELLAAVINGDCGLDDFKGGDPDPSTPEAMHWESWQLMEMVGLVEGENVTQLGIDLIKYDDESLLR